MYHYIGSECPQTPPRDHRASTVPLKASPEVCFDEYKKVVSPFPNCNLTNSKIVDIAASPNTKGTKESDIVAKAQRELARKTLQEKFKRVYESPADSRKGSMLKTSQIPYHEKEVTQAPQIAEKHEEPEKKPIRSQSNAAIMPRKDSEPLKPSPSYSRADSRKYSDSKIVSTKKADISPKLHEQKVAPVKIQYTQPIPNDDIKTPSARSQCSDCSGSAAKGMEYICVHCENKELENDKKRQSLQEKMMKTQVDSEAKKKLEEAKIKQLEEHAEFRKRMNDEMRNSILQSTEKKSREKNER